MKSYIINCIEKFIAKLFNIYLNTSLQVYVFWLRRRWLEAFTGFSLSERYFGHLHWGMGTSAKPVKRF